MMKPVNFGIDLGTTNSLIARYDANKVHVFKNPVGQKETLASVVAYRPDRILVGDKAREYLTRDPVNVFGNFKRKMGTDEKYYVVNIDDNVTPVQLSALVLKELKNFIHTGEIPEACVITVPASFDTMQSNATLQCRIYDVYSNRNSFYDNFSNSYNWNIETATYRGDSRALTAEDLRLINNSFTNAPGREEIADRLLRDSYSMLLSRINNRVSF